MEKTAPVRNRTSLCVTITSMFSAKMKMMIKPEWGLFLIFVVSGLSGVCFATPEDDFRTGVRYYFGRDGVQKNEREGAAWFRKAAEQGQVQAQMLLGACYVLGRGVECNLLEAKKWLEKAAAQGHEDAQTGLRSVEAQIDESLEKCRQASRFYDEKQYVDAAALWRQAADAGIPEGQHNLARMYYLGQGVEKSEVEFERRLNKAASQGYDPSVQLLTAWKKSEQPQNAQLQASHQALSVDDFVNAAEQGNIAEVKKMIDAGMDVNRARADGQTALIRASRGQKEVVQLLIDSGANVNQGDKDNATALIHAAYKKQPEIVKILIANGADVNAFCTNYGTTAIYSAAQEGCVECVKFF